VSDFDLSARGNLSARIPTWEQCQLDGGSIRAMLDDNQQVCLIRSHGERIIAAIELSQTGAMHLAWQLIEAAQVSIGSYVPMDLDRFLTLDDIGRSAAGCIDPIRDEPKGWVDETALRDALNARGERDAELAAMTTGKQIEQQFSGGRVWEIERRDAGDE
jgi:hypothetical protein